MSSFYANWNNQEVYQGGIVSMIGLGSGIYEIPWSGYTSNEPKALPPPWTGQYKLQQYQSQLQSGFWAQD